MLDIKALKNVGRSRNLHSEFEITVVHHATYERKGNVAWINWLFMKSMSLESEGIASYIIYYAILQQTH